MPRHLLSPSDSLVACGGRGCVLELAEWRQHLQRGDLLARGLGQPSGLRQALEEVGEGTIWHSCLWLNHLQRRESTMIGKVAFMAPCLLSHLAAQSQVRVSAAPVLGILESSPRSLQEVQSWNGPQAIREHRKT